MLELLEPLLLVLLSAVVEIERVPPSRSLSDLEVSGLVGRSLLLDVVQPLDLEEGHEREDLEESEAGNLGEGTEGVGVAGVVGGQEQSDE